MKFIVCLIPMLLLMACNTGTTSISDESSNLQYLGKEITDKGSISIAQLMSKMESKSEMKAKVKGSVTSVCQVKGCWMTMQQESDSQDDMMIKFKDYGFFMPKDISGKEVIIEGVARLQETSVDELRHYAEDAGASPEEIAKITEAKQEVVFEAEGVIIKN